MKIGLLTYHHSSNYGAIMQSYATARALKELGHDVEFINIEQPEKKSSKAFIFYFKLKAFKRFMDKFYPPETKVFASLDELQKADLDFDCLIVGSDQVWNPQISKDKCLVYFLDFGKPDIKRLSYASSFALKEWPKDKENLLLEIDRCLHRFKAISVREKTGADLAERLFGLKASVVVDPTMLHDNYDEITNGPVQENGEVIGYILNKTPLQLEKSRILAKKIGKKPLMISTIWPKRGFRYVYPPSIESWIKYIGGAKFVMTDSFHGLAFSLIYKRNFVVITPNNGRNSRLKDLLDSCGLGDRYFMETDDIPYDRLIHNPIDYGKVYESLNVRKEFSWNFLKENLND